MKFLMYCYYFKQNSIGRGRYGKSFQMYNKRLTESSCFHYITSKAKISVNKKHNTIEGIGTSVFLY